MLRVSIGCWQHVLRKAGFLSMEIWQDLPLRSLRLEKSVSRYMPRVHYRGSGPAVTPPGRAAFSNSVELGMRLWSPCLPGDPTHLGVCIKQQHETWQHQQSCSCPQSTLLQQSQLGFFGAPLLITFFSSFPLIQF